LLYCPAAFDSYAKDIIANSVEGYRRIVVPQVEAEVFA
jgi:hypothetical protein